MAYPRSLGHVMSFSRNLLILFTGSGMIASNGYKQIEDKGIVGWLEKAFGLDDAFFYGDTTRARHLPEGGSRAKKEKMQ